MAQTTLIKSPKTTKQKETFELRAPEAKEVSLAGSWTEWEKKAVRLRKQKNGTWKSTVSLAPGVYEYRFLVDGQWADDPQCADRRPNGYGAENCVREVR
jgi:1,4-alpha-glucan branching enzyme